MPQRFDPLPFEIDHVVARKHGGATEPGNLALSCWSCNSSKGANVAGIDPATGQLQPLFHPRGAAWPEHFRWDLGHLVALTAIGRTTIAVLGINSPARVSFRAELADEGEWPPA